MSVAILDVVLVRDKKEAREKARNKIVKIGDTLFYVTKGGRCVHLVETVGETATGVFEDIQKTFDDLVRAV